MVKTKTHEEFVNEINKLNPNIEVLSMYVNAHTNIKFRCKICGYKWESTPSTIRKSKGCLQCAGKIITPEYYRKLVFDMVGDEYEVLSDYKNYNTKIEYRHNVCGTKFKMKPVSFKESQSKCSNPYCKRKIHILKNKENFIQKVDELGYIVKSEYLGIDEPMDFQCKKCNTIFSLNKASKIYENVDTSHCPNCASNIAMSISSNEFYKKFNDNFGDEFEIISDYSGCDSPIKILHKKCGNISEYYRAGKIFSEYICPCKYCNISNGEKAIMNFLESRLITYEYQKKYNSLFAVNNGVLSYDFYIPNNNVVIEFQGKQHFEPIEYFGGKEYFDIQQEHDRRKRQYAKDHSIKLLEIAYWDFDNIEEILSRELGLTA